MTTNTIDIWRGFLELKTKAFHILRGAIQTTLVNKILDKRPSPQAHSRDELRRTETASLDYRTRIQEKKGRALQMRRQEQDMEQCKENMTTCAQLVFCWYCSPFEDKPKRCACAASLSAVQYGGILTGYAAANSSSLGLGIGIPAVALGAVTSIGLCAHELQKGDSASSSAPVEVQPGVTVGSPAVISQPRWERKTMNKPTSCEIRHGCKHKLRARYEHMDISGHVDMTRHSWCIFV